MVNFLTRLVSGGALLQYTHSYDSPLGRILLASDGAALTGLWFEGQKYYAAALDTQHKENALPVFEQAESWLNIYFGGKEPDFTPPLAPTGSEFRREVWELLLSIPYGKTVTYAELASAIAERRGLAHMSAQAVGGAVGHNPISIIIPCHRVVGSGGSLTGYAGGIDRKIKLLSLEGADMSGLYVPKKGTAL